MGVRAAARRLVLALARYHTQQLLNSARPVHVATMWGPGSQGFGTEGPLDSIG